MAGLDQEPVNSVAATIQAPVVLPKTSESAQLLKIRHSMSHVMAMAVQKLFPEAQVTIGPWTESGFYYDFDPPEPFTEKDLRKIKKEVEGYAREDKRDGGGIGTVRKEGEGSGSAVALQPYQIVTTPTVSKRRPRDIYGRTTLPTPNRCALRRRRRRWPLFRLT